MTIEPRPLDEPRYNLLPCWLSDPAIHLIEKAAVARNVTTTTMLAIIVSEWIALQLAIEEVETAHNNYDLLLTVENPDAIDVREAAAGEYAAEYDAQDQKQIDLSDFTDQPPRSR